VLHRVPYQDNPPRSEYRLTEKGRDLWHVVTAMRQWGDRWAAPHGPRIEVEHTGCGHVVQVLPTCSACGEVLDARDVRAVPGPAASPESLLRTRLAAATTGEGKTDG
jgi:hypothetical protein